MITSQLPYPGLRPFERSESDIFFGREEQTDQLLRRLENNRFLAVVGPSGCGKSSLVRAGMIAGLEAGYMANAGARWRVATMRPGARPFRKLAAALLDKAALESECKKNENAAVFLEATLRRGPRGLVEALGETSLPQGANLLLLVDQFEEIFRFRATADQDEADAFVALLLESAAQREVPIYVVLTMRSDYLGDCAVFTGLPEALNESQYLTPRLTREQRRSAIVGPARVFGGDVEPQLVNRILNEMGPEPDLLPVFQHLLMRMWTYDRSAGSNAGGAGLRGRPVAQNRTLVPALRSSSAAALAVAEPDGEITGRVLTLADYHAVGGFTNALSKHANEVFDTLNEKQQQTATLLFRRLCERGSLRDVRRPTPLQDIMDLAHLSLAEVTTVADTFRNPANSFLAPSFPEPLTSETILDITHESLIRQWDRLNLWADLEEESARTYRFLQETARLWKEGEAALWGTPNLEAALHWKEKERPTKSWAKFYGGRFDEAMSFLAESQAHRDKQAREREENQQRELRQAQDLVAERQRRIEEQTHAAIRLRRGLAALAVVAVILLFVAGYASYEKKKATIAENHAKKELNAKESALAAKTEATNLAEKRAYEAETADKEMRLEALRVRDVNLHFQSQLSEMAERVRSSSPQQFSYLLGDKGEALFSLGNYDDAEELFSLGLESVPDDGDARTSRGYLHLLRNQPGEALKDFKYFQRHIDRASPLNNLNLTIAYAAVGNYSAAKESLKEAVENMRHKEVVSGGEIVIPPDITRATGRTTLEASGATFEAALYYMQANLEAYAGDIGGFQAALSRADKKAEPLSTVARKDAYFVAMTWAWLRCPDSAKCVDYGAFASEAQLWERAGYEDWAACDYQRFQDRDRQSAEKRYSLFAQWIEQNRTREARPSSGSCQRLAEREPDVLTLQVEASEARASKDFANARKLLDQALTKATEPEKIGLLLDKAYVLFSNGETETQRAGRARSGKVKERHEQKARNAFQELKDHSGQILKINPESSTAYLYRALAKDWLKQPRETILRDVLLSLKFDPANLDALRMVDNLVPDGQPEEGRYLVRYREFLDRYYKTSRYRGATTFMHQAKLAKKQGRYVNAREFIDQAIVMDPGDPSLYEFRAEIQRGLDFDESQVKHNLADGYLQAGNILKMRKNFREGEEADKKARGILAELAESRTNGDIRCNSNREIETPPHPEPQKEPR